MNGIEYLTKINVTHCHPGDIAAETLSRENSHIRWVNHDRSNREVIFDDDVPAIFLGCTAPLRFTVPARGSIELQLDQSVVTPKGQYHYSISGEDCTSAEGTDSGTTKAASGAHVIIVGP